MFKTFEGQRAWANLSFELSLVSTSSRSRAPWIMLLETMSSAPEQDRCGESAGQREYPGQRGAACQLNLVVNTDLALSRIARLSRDVDAGVGGD